MSCLGVHFAADEVEVAKLKGFDDEIELLDYFRGVFEKTHMKKDNEDWYFETGKVWDGIHRSLTDGRFLNGNGKYPLNCVILGGEELYTEDDYILFLKSPTQVRDIAAALEGYTQDRFRNGYALITKKNCDWPASDNDCDISWLYFKDLSDFYRRAAAANKYVIFSADQ